MSQQLPRMVITKQKYYLNMRKIILMLGIFKSLVGYSQSFGSHKIALTPTVFPEVNFNAEEYKKKLSKKFQNETKSSDLERYINQDAAAKQSFFSSNQIYNNWNESSEYVRKVFKQSIPKEYNLDDIKIYVVRDPQPNAFCMEDGNIAVTVGFLSFINSEAELASTLCHEFGHYYSNHLFLEYKKKNTDRTLKELSPFIVSLIINDKLSQFQQDQERQADTFSFSFFNNNGYSPKAIAQSFNNFKKVTTKYKKSNNYRQPLFYFATHPSDDERITNAENAFKNNLVKGRNFIVDSVTFCKVKKQAIDETLYLLFEHLDYDECLEMAFLQHLYYPKDEFYLFFITECLRRQIAFNSDFKSELFITANYDNLSKTENSANNLPAFVKGKTKVKLSKKIYEKSIFQNLKSEIYNLTDNDIARIDAKELIQNDTLEFLHNEDALDYFTSKIPQNACVFNIQKMLLGLPTNNNCDDLKNYSELEGDYVKTVESYKDFIKSSNKYSKAPIILFKITTKKTTTGYASVPFYDPVLVDDLYNEYISIASNYESEFIDTKNKFNFRELQKIRNTSSFIDALNLKGFFGKKEEERDFLSIFPEISFEINKFN
jgi:Zn-dependent protease with chaperone function